MNSAYFFTLGCLAPRHLRELLNARQKRARNRDTLFLRQMIYEICTMAATSNIWAAQ